MLIACAIVDLLPLDFYGGMVCGGPGAAYSNRRTAFFLGFVFGVLAALGVVFLSPRWVSGWLKVR
jgi:hypothetical protein